MFGVSFMEIAVIIAISLFFFQPAEILSFIAKLINLIENLKAKLEDLKNEAFAEAIDKSNYLKDITPSEKMDMSQDETEENFQKQKDL